MYFYLPSHNMRKQTRTKVKSKLHKRNKHRERYNFPKLIEAAPDLKPFVIVNDYKDQSINFFDPEAVKMLNKALLKLHYNIDYWEIPDNYLCPPIPGRADYLHYVADLLEKVEKNGAVKCLDIGVGANCIYPLLGAQEYGWSFVGSDIDETAIEYANNNVNNNPSLKDKVEIRHQKNRLLFFNGIVKREEQFDVTICNPPFHTTADAAQKANLRKLKNLKNNRVTKSVKNFGGQHNELWYEGGEKNFATKLIRESVAFKHNCKWFTTLISKKINLGKIYKELEIANAKTVETIPMGTGNKISRIVAWTWS